MFSHVRLERTVHPSIGHTGLKLRICLHCWCRLFYLPILSTETISSDEGPISVLMKVLYILKQKSYVRLTFMSASAKCMNAFHLNFHITKCDHLESFFT